ncbi:DUF3035 domain-containing protein [Novispirillum sp. DQ9]|uniref:DUF3035 domain-containing protein n=1 Tax=Novispirillum sp. DQ9 TaxID=3398612 RepID=UPI003C7CC5E2
MTRGLLLSLCSVALAASLTGCGSGVKETLGLNRQAPDEFQVVSRPPLAIPPDFRLRPPEPGAPPTGMGTAQDMGRAALYGSNAQQGGWVRQGGQGLSGGEQSFLSAVGADRATPDIRATVNRESSILAEEERPFTDRLVFWRDPPPSGTVVDADAEARRLRERQALGEPVTQGDTPTIKREQRGMFEGLF